MACAERLPARHTATIGLSLGSSLARGGELAQRQQRAPRIWPSGPVNSLGSRTSSTCTLARFSSSQCGSTSQTPREGEAQRRPVGIVQRAASRCPAGRSAGWPAPPRRSSWDAAGRGSSCSRHSRPRRPRRRAADCTSSPRRRWSRSGRDSRAPDRAGSSRAARRCASAPSGRARAGRPAGSRCGPSRGSAAVAGEGHALVVEHVGQAAAGVAGRRPHLERAAAELDAVAVLAAGGRRPCAPLASASAIWLPSCCFSSQAPVTWSAWTWVSSVH